MRSPSTIYLVTRTHGRRIHLLKSESIKVIAKSKNLSDVVDQLLRSDYSTEISKIPSEELDSIRLEKIFLKTLVDRFFILPKDTKGKTKEFLEKYASRIEVENLKRILRAKHAKERIGEANLIPLTRKHTIINFPALIKSESIDETISLLRETPYAALNERLDTYRRVGLPLILESFLDNIYFIGLWEIIDGLPDNDGLKWLVGEEADLRNLELVFASKMRDLSLRLIEDMLIPVFYKLSQSTLKKVAQGGIENSPVLLAGTSYDDAAEELLKSKEPSIDLEVILSKRLYQDASAALSQLFLKLGYVVAYMLLCEREAKDLIAITTALDLKISEEDLKRRLL